MFLQWSFFETNFLLLILDILVATFFTAVLACAARHSQHHSQTIRWAHQVGLMEMVKMMKNSTKKVQKMPFIGLKVKWGPFVRLVVTFVSGYFLVGILAAVKVFFINATTGENGHYNEVVVSRQFITNTSSTSYLPAWSFPVPYNTRTEDALTNGINSTYALPRASLSKRYRPRLSEYEIACDQLDFSVNANGDSGGSISLSNTGCANMTLIAPIVMDSNLTGSYVVQEPKGRAKIVILGESLILNATAVGLAAEVPLLLRLKPNANDYCLMSDKPLQLFSSAKSGLTSYPLTALTKCNISSGGMVSLATSTVRFSVPEPGMFHPIATSLFGSQDELVSSMEVNLNNLTLIDLSRSNNTLAAVTEVNIVDTKVTILMCISAKQIISPNLSCAYVVAHTVITQPRPMNPDITRMFPDGGISKYVPRSAVVMTLSHFPLISMDKPIFDIPKALNSSQIATSYLAAVGQNFIMDWGRSTLYIAYDTVDIVKGYEIPDRVLWTLVGVMGGCLVIIGATECLLESKYTRSLYFLASEELSAGLFDGRPQLYKFDIDTLKLEGRKIISTKPPQRPEETDVLQKSISGSKNPLIPTAV
ncbi:hypothetical protein EMPS_09892 [Entomortierella parvispora]|uniref:Transmembrane protein n=1 Tax=Entomortierella parvispora TaxID=205924 RepID=A0A9P3HJ86_9FUNG|nr:hypothetical protein EMPS_09892 [Entomortierella parvispora]